MVFFIRDPADRSLKMAGCREQSAGPQYDHHAASGCTPGRWKFEYNNSHEIVQFCTLMTVHDLLYFFTGRLINARGTN